MRRREHCCQERLIQKLFFSPLKSAPDQGSLRSFGTNVLESVLLADFEVYLLEPPESIW
jgi:hypothetical protein